jgi:hypothetical protein
VVKRRTLGDGLTPDEKQFLHGAIEAPKVETTRAEQKTKEPVSEPLLPKENVQTPEIATTSQHPAGMMGLNTRVPPHISAALLRASVDRKIERRSRAAVQDIVNEALTEWLIKAGYIT